MSFFPDFKVHANGSDVIPAKTVVSKPESMNEWATERINDWMDKSSQTYVKNVQNTYKKRTNNK